MKERDVLAWTRFTATAATALLIGCGGNEAPIHPVVKQEIAPERTLKKINPFDQKKNGLSPN
jgi:hypothetical protein